MIINENRITFEQSDIDALPADTQEALADYDAGISAADTLSGAVNAFLSSVKQLAKVRSLDRFKVALDAAPAETQAQVNLKLDEAKVILGIQFLPKPIKK